MEYLVTCENDMLRSGNLGLKMGVSPTAHTQYDMEVTPPGSVSVVMVSLVKLKLTTH